MPVTDTIVTFLRDIGLEVRIAPLPPPTFLPGVTLDRGAIVYDPEHLAYPGDLLHEAGHLAFIPAATRAVVSDGWPFDAGEEMAAIAWSYAAALNLGLDPSVVFHPHGYRGGSGAILTNFEAGRYVGVPLLQWADMTERYPVMTRWLRD